MATTTTTTAPAKSQSQSQQQRTGNGSGSGTCTLLLFASAATYTGGIETLSLPAPTTLRGVFAALESRFPGFTRKVLRASAVTVNLEYVDFEIEEEIEGKKEEGQGKADGDGKGEGEGLDMPIQPGDEVGIIPPVSSG